LNVKIVNAFLRSMSPYSQSRHHSTERLPSETNSSQGNQDYSRRTWPNHLHVSESGTILIPPMALKNALSEAAKFLALPLKGKATYTKFFEAGVLTVKPLDTGVLAVDAVAEELFLPSDGVRGSGKRVLKTYPKIFSWAGDAEFIVIDDTVLQSYAGDRNLTVFQYVLQQSGSVIGLGRFRPRQNGFYGRFMIESFAISDA
jgi:hypothetical protein